MTEGGGRKEVFSFEVRQRRINPSNEVLDKSETNSNDQDSKYQTISFINILFFIDIAFPLN